MIPPITANECVLGPLVRSDIYYDHFLVTTLQFFNGTTSRQHDKDNPAGNGHGCTILIYDSSILH